MLLNGLLKRIICPIVGVLQNRVGSIDAQGRGQWTDWLIRVFLT